ncbi:MAG: hypothetical protein RL291_1946 [Pseudomonadota bacterium]|jgi:adenylyltransferase/sulfurtransferase
MSTLTPDEIARYKRHLVLRDVGGQGQQKLKSARVLLIGAGGLGAPLALYLAAAGVGTLGIVDDDTVSLDNLQRQIIHDTDAVGRLKVDSAAASLDRVNPHVKVEAHAQRLTPANARALISDYDIVADGSDNFATRYLVSDEAYRCKRTLVFGAVGPFEGYVSTFKPHERAPDGKPFPTYRCLFPESPGQRDIANCAEVGVLGSVVGVIGTLQATEVLKEILGIGRSLAGRLLIWDALDQRFDEVRVTWNPENALNGTEAQSLSAMESKTP